MKNREVEISIDGYTKKGNGLGHYTFADNNKRIKVEVPHALKGDRVLVDLKRQKKGWCKGKLLRLISPSSSRVSPICKHSGVCGGCPWQELNYLEQLKEKEREIRSLFAYLQEASFSPIIGAEPFISFRNKMEYSFSQNMALTHYLGLTIASVGRYVFNVEECPVSPPWFAKVLIAVRKWWESTNIKAYNMHDDNGSLRTLTLRGTKKGVKDTDKLVMLTVSGNPKFALTSFEIEIFLATLKEILGDNFSFVLREHKIEKGTPSAFSEKVLFGSGYLLEDMTLKERKFTFKISPSAFFQPNTFQAERLYNLALNSVPLNKNMVLFDLYCGIATLSLSFASLVKEVVGIEINEEAVVNAKENAALNNIDNFKIFAGDVGKTLTKLYEKDFSRPDVVIVDPPRAGLDDLALHHIKNLKPQYIIYISCNPQTQKENIEALLSNYKVIKIEPLDQFPYTAHIENLVVLKSF